MPWFIKVEELTTSDTEKLRDWLKLKLKPNIPFSVIGKRIRIDVDSKDGAFKIGQFARYQNPLRPLFYEVLGYNEHGQQIFTSGCPRCKANQGDHTTHLLEEKL